MQCPACGAEIRTVELGDGSKVRIDARSTLGKGPRRYIVESENAAQAYPASPTFEGAAHADHRDSCEAR